MFIRYPQAIVCRVTGKDGKRYLQNRLSNDIQALPPGASCSAAALSPQGKIEGVFLVINVAEGEYLLAADGGERSQVLGALQRFKVAERAEFKDESDSVTVFHCDGILDSIKAPGGFVAKAPRFSSTGMHLIVPRGESTEVIKKLTALTQELSGEALTIERVRKNVPSFPEELNDKLLLSEAGVKDLISFTKGCYVGQEVVAKIDALGKAPRVLVRFRSTNSGGSLQGASVSVSANETRSVGTILTSVSDGASGEEIGFAALKNDPAVLKGALLAAGSSISLL